MCIINIMKFKKLYKTLNMLQSLYVWMGQTDRKNPHVRSSKRPSLYKTRYNTYPPARKHLPPPPQKKRKKERRSMSFVKDSNAMFLDKMARCPCCRLAVLFTKSVTSSNSPRAGNNINYMHHNTSFFCKIKS